MFEKVGLPRRKNLHLFFAVFSLFFFIFSISQTVFALPNSAEENQNTFISESKNPYLVERFWEGGKQIDKIIVPGKPPEGLRAHVARPPVPNIALGTNTLQYVPAFDWSYGCSATSAAMMMGYYDNSGFPNMYAGPGGVPAGVCPMDNSEWGTTTWPSGVYSECPLSATHQGKDGLGVKGHVDDYWIDYGDAGPDPWIGHWAEHTHAGCTADYMGTNQSSLGASDGATYFYFDGGGSPLYDYTGEEPDYRDGCHGLRLFVESRGYSVDTNFTQLIYPNPVYSNTHGFTFDDFKDEIDVGRPVLIHVYGHTMLGYGYDTTGSLIYIHDTWDCLDHEMTWGGDYSGLPQMAVTVLRTTDAPLPPSKGTVALDSEYYTVFAVVNVIVRDRNLAGTGTMTVDFTSDPTADAEEGFVLNETGASTGIFAGSIDLELNDVPTSDSILQVHEGDTITVTYIDADDGEGGTYVEVTDTALVITPLGAPTLSATAGINNSVTLQWNSIVSPILAGYNVYRSTSPGLSYLVRLNTIHLIYKSPFQDVGLIAGRTYYYYVTAEDSFGNEIPSNIVGVTITTPTPTGGGEEGPGKLSGGCFIATACYGTPMAKEVRVLSNFRDEYLMTNSLGRIFVGTYYKVSPEIASFISEHPLLKSLVRACLKPVVKVTGEIVEK